MPEINYSIDSVLGGVSQQASSVRRPDQCKVLTNGFINLTDGLHKRSPSEHVVKAYTTIATPAAGTKLHTIDRGDSQEFAIVVSSGAIKAYTSSGSSITVNDVSGDLSTYMTCSSPISDLKLVTVQDTTFIVNTTILAIADSTTSSAPYYAQEGFIFVRAANYGQTYRVKIKPLAGAEITYTATTWDGTKNTGIQGPGGPGTLIPATGYVSISTESIALELTSAINAGSGTHGFTAVRYGSVIHIYGASNINDYVRVEDSVGNTSLNLAYRQIDQAENFLPDICRDGFKIKVIGDIDRDIDDYYLEFIGDKNDSLTVGKGYWQESVNTSTLIRLKGTTLPHTLTWNGSSFDFNKITWTDRAVGDTGSNPWPSFVNRYIKDIFYYKDRLGMVADDRICLSEQGYYYNFFRTTTRQLIDTDRIDVQMSTNRVVDLNHALPFNNVLLLISERGQHALAGQDVLAPRTVSVVPATEYPSSATCAPVISGRSVYLADKVGDYGMVREFLQFSDGQAFDAFDVTSQIPTYINGEIVQMAGSNHHDCLAVITDDQQDLYIYKFVWSGNSKVVSAWCKWTFGKDIVSISWLGDTLFFLINREDGQYIEKINPGTGFDTGLSFLVRVDRRLTQANCAEAYNAGTGLTTITLPYQYDTDSELVLVDSTGNYHVATSYPTTTTATFRGNYSSGSYWLGQSYDFTFQPGEPILKSQVQGGYGVAPTGPMKVRRGYIRYKDSRSFTVTVTVDNRETFEYLYNPETVTNTETGDIDLKDGEFQYPIVGQADNVDITITNSTPYPSNIVSMAYTVSYKPKATPWR